MDYNLEEELLTVEGVRVEGNLPNFGDNEEVDWEEPLPDNPLAEGFTYLFSFLNNLTTVEKYFTHKIYALLAISGKTNQAYFTKADLDMMLVHYPKIHRDYIIVSLLEGGWLDREEGTQEYGLTKEGLRFIKLLPLLYAGSGRESTVAIKMLNQAMEMANTMEMPDEMLLYLRNQAIQQIIRDQKIMTEALTSRNQAKLREASELAEEHLDDINKLLLEQHRLFQIVPDRIMAQEAHDAIQTLMLLFHQVVEHRKEGLLGSNQVGKEVFTKEESDQFIYTADFDELANMIDQALHVPSGASWLDEADLFYCLEQFLKRRRVGLRQRYSLREPLNRVVEDKENRFSHLDKAKGLLKKTLNKKQKIGFKDFILNSDDKVEVLMNIATLCFIDGKNNQVRPFFQPELDFLMDIETEVEKLQDCVLREVSKGYIRRR